MLAGREDRKGGKAVGGGEERKVEEEHTAKLGKCGQQEERNEERGISRWRIRSYGAEETLYKTGKHAPGTCGCWSLKRWLTFNLNVRKMKQKEEFGQESQLSMEILRQKSGRQDFQILLRCLREIKEKM